MKKYGCRPGFIIALLLVLTFTAQWSLKAHHWELVFPDEPTSDLSEAILEAIPKQAKTMVADACWLQADEYMHFGPSKRLPQVFRGGAYAGHTEMLPLLQLIVMLDPQHIDACVILVQSLSLHLKKFDEGMRTLQKVILANKKNPRVSELYGAAAHMMGFRNSYGPEANNRDAALRYIDKALATWQPPKNGAEADPILTPTAYATWKARFLVDKGLNKEALATWRAAGLPMGEENGLLAKYLTMVAYGLPVPKSPDDLLKKPSAEEQEINRKKIQEEEELERQKNQQAAPHAEHQEEECDHSGGCEHGIKPSPLQTGVLHISLQAQLMFFAFAIVVFGWLSRTGRQRR